MKNIGQLNSKNYKRLTLSSVTPFHPKEIFITAENEGYVSYHFGIEISYTIFLAVIYCAIFRSSVNQYFKAILTCDTQQYSLIYFSFLLAGKIGLQ